MTGWLKDKVPFSVKLFLKRQRARLSSEKPSSNQKQFNTLRKHDASVIVFDEVLPTPDRDAGSARMFLILRFLTRHYHTVFVYRTKVSDPRYEQSLWQEGIETVDLIYYAQVLKQQNFKAAIVSRPDLTHTLLPSLRTLAPQTKIIFDSVDAHYRRLEREYKYLVTTS